MRFTVWRRTWVLLGSAAILFPGLVVVWVAPRFVAVGWTDSDGALLHSVVSTLVQLLGTFISIMIVYVVFKLSVVFPRLEEEEEGLRGAAADIRTVRGAQQRMRHLLEKKVEYVRPLHLPVAAMAGLLLVGLAILPFTGLLATNQVAELRLLVLYSSTVALVFAWTVLQAFGTAIAK